MAAKDDKHDAFTSKAMTRSTPMRWVSSTAVDGIGCSGIAEAQITASRSLMVSPAVPRAWISAAAPSSEAVSPTAQARSVTPDLDWLSPGILWCISSSSVDVTILSGRTAPVASMRTRSAETMVGR